MDASKLHNFQFFCIPEPKYDFTKEGDTVVYVSYMFYVLKLFDLFDTIFFILRKKNNQASFLHIYHHAGIVVVFYLYFKLLSGGGNGTIFGKTSSIKNLLNQNKFHFRILEQPYARRHVRILLPDVIYARSEAVLLVEKVHHADANAAVCLLHGLLCYRSVCCGMQQFKSLCMGGVAAVSGHAGTVQRLLH